MKSKETIQYYINSNFSIQLFLRLKDVVENLIVFEKIQYKIFRNVSKYFNLFT